jgi:methylase of polypeptide subunit release factors
MPLVKDAGTVDDMTHHHAHAHVHGGPAHDGDARLADLLDLDAEIHGPYLDEVTEWVERYAPATPGRVVDVGAGTGTGTLALARRFPGAEVVAIDTSASMLERLAAAATAHGLTGRLRAVQADLDVAWPEVGGIDVAWASS